MRRITTVLLAMAALTTSGIAYGTGTTMLVSAGLNGAPSAGISGAPSISADGRYVAFTSSGATLVAGDTNRVNDVFVRDRQTGVTTRVSVDSAGGQADNSSGMASISADGRFVAFMSAATNLVPGDTNQAQDVFLHDQLTGATSRISVGWLGEQSNSDSLHPAISADGRHIAYDSFASNIVYGDTNGVTDVFEYDLSTNRTDRISVDSNGMQANGMSWLPSISADGRYVAFTSNASNIALFPDTNRATDVFVHDTLYWRTDRVSLNSDGDEGNGASRFASMSADGRYFVYESYASNLIPGDTNNNGDLFLYDRWRSTVTRVDVGPEGEQDPDGATMGIRPSISADGRYVAFESGQASLVPNDTNNSWDIFVRDRVTATTTRASVAADGTEGDADSQMPVISADGRHVAFMSYATDFAPGSIESNPNVFARDLTG